MPPTRRSAAAARGPSWPRRAEEFKERVERYFEPDAGVGTLTHLAFSERCMGEECWTLELLFRTTDGFLEGMGYETIEMVRSNQLRPSEEYTKWNDEMFERQKLLSDDPEYENIVGPRYHNLIRLKFATVEGYLVGTLDSYFYYTHNITKTQFKAATRGKNLNDLVALSKQFAREIGCFAFTLLDGFSGWNKVNQKYFDSKDLKGKFPPASSASPGTEYLTQRFLYQSPPDRTRAGVATAMGGAGFYGLYGFISRTQLDEMDGTVARLPAVRFAFGLCGGEANSQMICFHLVGANVNGQPVEVALESNPQKALGLPSTSIVMVQETDVSGADKSFYDAFLPGRGRRRRRGVLCNVLTGRTAMQVQVSSVPDKPVYGAAPRAAFVDLGVA